MLVATCPVTGKKAYLHGHRWRPEWWGASCLAAPDIKARRSLIIKRKGGLRYLRGGMEHLDHPEDLWEWGMVDVKDLLDRSLEGCLMATTGQVALL